MGVHERGRDDATMYRRMRMRMAPAAVGGLLLAYLLIGLPTSGTAAEAISLAGQLLKLKTAYHTRFNVYVAGPEQAVRGALLVPDRWGFHRPAMAWAERLAAQGYRAVVVDYFEGRRVPDEVTAREILRDIDPVWIEANLDSALSYLRRRQQQVVVVAWGEGIAHAMDLVQRRPGEVQALVSYHTRRSKDLTPMRELTVPMLEVVTERSLLRRTGGVPAQAVEEAWQATLEFLSANLE